MISKRSAMLVLLAMLGCRSEAVEVIGVTTTTGYEPPMVPADYCEMDPYCCNNPKDPDCCWGPGAAACCLLPNNPWCCDPATDSWCCEDGEECCYDIGDQACCDAPDHPWCCLDDEEPENPACCVDPWDTTCCPYVGDDDHCCPYGDICCMDDEHPCCIDPFSQCCLQGTNCN